jgi:hypothetical protein
MSRTGPLYRHKAVGRRCLARSDVVGYDALKRKLLELTPDFSVRELTLHIESISARSDRKLIHS